MNKELGRICILSNDYPSERRPVYVFVEQLVNTFVDLGGDICVLAPQSLTKSLFRRIPIRPRKQYYTTDNGNKYMVFRPYVLSFGNHNNWLYKLTAGFNRRSVEKYLTIVSPDLLYAHFWNNAIRIMDYAKREKKPIFVACGEGDNAMEEMMASLSASEKEMLSCVVKGVICVSSENKRKCINFGLASEQNIIVLPNAVNSQLFHPVGRNTNLRKELGVANDDFLLIFVGSFTNRKGSGRLAKAIESINDRHVKVMFIGAPMPGDADDPKCEGIVFKGLVNHNNLPSYYACADVFVLPTLKEGCSNAIVEALAMGLPIISSNGSFNDDILNVDNSIRINPSCVSEIANAIVKLRGDDNYRNKLANGALKTGRVLLLKKRVERIIFFMKQKTVM